MIYSKYIFVLNTIYNNKRWTYVKTIKAIITIAFFLIANIVGKAQNMYGTTGLLYAPTAEMQKDKTLMIGGSMIDHNIYRSSYWSNSREYDPFTYNYYVSVQN